MGSKNSSAKPKPDSKQTGETKANQQPRGAVYTLIPLPPCPNSPWMKEHCEKHKCKELTLRKLKPSTKEEGDRVYLLHEPVSLTSPLGSISATTDTVNADSKDSKATMQTETKDTNANQQQKRPLVLCLHGTDENVWQTELIHQESGHESWLELSDKLGFYAAFGQSQCYESDSMSWRPVHDKFRSAWAPGETDLTYVSRLLDDMIQNFPIDTDRIYVIGFSNGGLFLSDILLNASLGKRFAAACNYMGGIAVEQLETFGMTMDNTMEETTLLSSYLEKVEKQTRAVSEAEALTIAGSRKHANAHALADKAKLRKIPLYLITGSRDDNRPPTYRAWGVFSLLGFPLRFLDLWKIPHQVQQEHAAEIWTYFQAAGDKAAIAK